MKIDPYKIIEKYYKKDSVAYNFVVIHSNMVAQKALEIAKNLTHLEIDFDFLEEACLLHDIWICMVNAPQLWCYWNRPYVEHGHLWAEILRKEWLPKHALACERHLWVWLSKEEIIRCNLQMPQIDFYPLTIEEELVWFADNFYTKVEWRLEIERSIKEIELDLLQYWKEKVEKFNDWLLKFNYFGYEWI